MKLDKKVIGGKNVFVLLKSLGNSIRVDDVAVREIKTALALLGGKP